MIAKSLIVHYPGTPADREALAKRVAHAHAHAVIEFLKALPCSSSQKYALTEALKCNPKYPEPDAATID